MSRRKFLICRASTSLAFGVLATFFGVYASAQTSIDGADTKGSTTASGGDITVTSTGTITIGSGAGITVNSNNSADNEGSITINDAATTAPSQGILVKGGFTGGISNGGAIINTDSAPSVDGTTAGENRYGIQVIGSSPFTGAIDNAAAGSISILGNDSAGIAVSSGGLTGSITTEGTIDVTGVRSDGILVQAPVGGGISVTNSITAVGQTAVGIAVNSSLGGQLYIDSSVSSTGFYNNGGSTTVRPTTFGPLGPGNYLLGGPAVFITGSIASGGVLVDTSGQLLSYGPAAALYIAPATTSVTISATTETGGAGLSILGTVAGNGIYDGVEAKGIYIGNPNTSLTTTIYNGISIAGTVSATSYAAGATAITLTNGSVVSSLTNSGTITSTVNLGESGVANAAWNSTAILVSGGALNSITNTGVITATSASGEGIAMDLTGDTVRVTVNQLPSNTTTRSSITGDILFGSAGATLNAETGTLSGTVSFGANATNALNISGQAVIDGNVTQAAGGTLALTIKNGRLASTDLTPLALRSATLGANSQVDFTVAADSSQSGSLVVSGQTQITSGAKLGLILDSQLTTPETYTVVQTSGSGTLVGAAATLGSLPYFYTGKIDQNDAAGTIAISVRDRTFAESGALGSAAAYKAVFDATYTDSGIRDAFNAAPTRSDFQRIYNQMLPSFSGGLFEILQQGSQAVASVEAATPLEESGQHGGGWAQQVGFGVEQGTRASPGFHGGGLGFAFGWETPISAISSWGVTVSYIRGAVDDFNTGPKNQAVGTAYSAGAYWRENDGSFRTEASLNVGGAEMNTTRNFSAADLGGTMVTRSASGAFSGGLAQAHVGVSYEQPLGDGYYVRPLVTGDYFVLYSDKYSERDGGPGFNLNVDSSTGKQGSVTGGVAVGTRWGDKLFLWKPEAMVGYTQVFGGPDDVKAAYASGNAFTLTPTSQKGGPVAHLGVHGGNKFSDIAVEAGGEDRGPYKSFDGRVVARFRF